jgi:hypothetical protein
MQPPASPPCGLPSRVARARLLDRRVARTAAHAVNPAEAGCFASLRPHQRDGVTLAPPRDAPVGVGTRNVPQDSPTPPARVEQGTMASKPARGAAGAARRQEPTPQRPLNPASEHPADFANLTPAGVPLVLFSRSPLTYPNRLTNPESMIQFQQSLRCSTRWRDHQSAIARATGEIHEH